MKTINKQIFRRYLGTGMLFSAIALLSACNKKLDEEVYSFVSTPNFYKTASDADAAVISIYASQSTGDYYRETFYHLGELSSDQVTIGRNSTFQAIDNWQLTPVHPHVTSVWTAMYRTISRSNIALSRIPSISMDETKKDYLLGEAYFLRAFNYFNLVRLWGGVPLILEEINSEDKTSAAKSSVDQVYAQIIKDLQEAEKLLPETRTGIEVGRVVKTSSQALLADVYLTRENWALAKEKAQAVMNSKKHELLTDFANIFSITNENNKEILFSIQFDGVAVGSAMSSFAHAFGADNPRAANGVQVWSVDVRSDMWKNWDNNDKRKAVSVYETIVNKAGQTVSVYNTGRPYPAFGKYNAPNEAGAQNSPVNPVVIRYAEVLLIYAEAASQANNGPTAEAYEVINQVRRRAYGVPVSTASAYDLPAGLSAADFREAVLNERSLEFTLENKRTFDLMRTKQFPFILKKIGIANINETATLFPIPQSEIDANEQLSAKDQNPGY